jgi:hypothetical protein
MARGEGKHIKVWSWRHAVLKSGLAATTRHVLLTLSCYMNDVGGACYPTIEQLVEDTGLGRSTVIEHLGRAVAAGWLKKRLHGFKGQEWKNNEYEACLPEPTELGLEEEKGSPANGLASPVDKKEGSPAAGLRTCEGSPANTPKVVQQLDTTSSSPLYTPPLARERAVDIFDCFWNALVTVWGEGGVRRDAMDGFEQVQLMLDRWIASGATVAICRSLFLTRQRQKRRDGQKPIYAFSYFDTAIPDAVQKAKAEGRKKAVAVSTPQDEAWLRSAANVIQCKAFRKYRLREVLTTADDQAITEFERQYGLPDALPDWWLTENKDAFRKLVEGVTA